MHRLREIAQVGKEEFLADGDIQAKAERWLHLATECCLDLEQIEGYAAALVRFAEADAEESKIPE